MRAATRKPGWYTRRGLPIPLAVTTHRTQLLTRTLRRGTVRDELAKARLDMHKESEEMVIPGDLTREEYLAATEQIKAMGLLVRP